MNSYIIAEIGCNHKGELEVARDMIKTAAEFCGVDVVKFQKRTNKELLSDEAYNTPHPVPENSYGPTYGEHREYLELDRDQHLQLMKWCNEFGVTYSTSVWDLTAAKEIAGLNPKLIKIPSASNMDFELLGWLCEHYAGEIHVSFGMTEREEEQAIVDFFKSNYRINDLVIYACTSGYPVPFEDICLFEVKRLKEQYGDMVKAVGFSGHHLGIAADIGALTLGATHIERHFTLDRTWKGTDHAASLEPDGMRRLVRDIRNVSKALRYKESEILDIEQEQRNKLKTKFHERKS